MPTAVTTHSYPRLLSRIRSAIKSGHRQIELTKALTYWKIGEDISKHLLNHNGRAGYGEKFYQKLSKDLNIGHRTLERTVQFHREFPIPSARTQLDWTHYRKLITVDDPILRNRLLAKAQKNNLTTRELSQEIKATRQAQQTQKTQLIPHKGPLNMYQIIASDRIKLPKGSVLLDCGFDFAKVIKRSDLKGVTLVKTRKDMSFTYKAYPFKVIDGDTLWAIIDLGFGCYTSQKLRLRDIDCPEIKTDLGKKAKAFVAKAFKGLEFIIIQSSKSDKYDRYLADVFTGGEEIYLNQQLLNEGLATGYKG